MNAAGRSVGRPKGSKDGPHVDRQARRETAYRNACGGRIMTPEDARDQLRAAKGMLARALSSDGVKWLLEIIAEGPPHWERQPDGTRTLVDGSAQFEWAMNFAADRAGLPRLAQVESTGVGGFSITFHDTRGALGWPGLAAGDDARHDGDADPVRAN